MLPTTRRGANGSEIWHTFRFDRTPLEIVVPYTTAHSVRSSVVRADELCRGLDAQIRIVRVSLVPYPLDLHCPPVSPESLGAEISEVRTLSPLKLDVRFSRERLPALLAALPEESLVVLTYRRRLLLTEEEKLARSLRKAGHHVAMFLEDRNAA